MSRTSKSICIFDTFTLWLPLDGYPSFSWFFLTSKLVVASRIYKDLERLHVLKIRKPMEKMKVAKYNAAIKGTWRKYEPLNWPLASVRRFIFEIPFIFKRQYFCITVVTFATLNLPRIIASTVEISNTDLIIKCVENNVRYIHTLTFYKLDVIAHMLMILNSAVNVIVYCAVSTPFQVSYNLSNVTF